MRRGASLVIALIALVATAASSVAQPGGGSVVVDRVRVEAYTQTAPVIGRLVSRQSAVIAARVAGPVADILVEIGDHVMTGDRLVQLDQQQLGAELELAEAEMQEVVARAQAATAQQAIAQQDVQRLEQLRGGAAFSQARYEDANQELVRVSALAMEARARLRRAEIAVELARLNYENAAIRAPFPGVVTDRAVGLGEYVSLGEAVVTLVNDTDIEIEVSVGAERAAALSPGLAVSVMLGDTADGDQTQYSAEVRTVVPVEDPMTRTRRVRLVPDLSGAPGQVAVGQSVTIMVPAGPPRDIVTVDKDAVLIGIDGASVFVVVDGTAQPRSVELGVALDNRYEVLSGLEPGDLAVVRGNERLRPGQTVEILDAPAADAAEQPDAPEDGDAAIAPGEGADS